MMLCLMILLFVLEYIPWGYFKKKEEDSTSEEKSEKKEES